MPETTILALKKFKEAYFELLDAFDPLNNTEAISLYPFEQSFDELDIATWTDESVRELCLSILRKAS